MIAVGFATKEDVAFFATTSQSGGPTSIYAASGTTTRLVGGSANGGTLGYEDLLGIIADAYAAGAQPPFVWAMHPNVFFQQIMGLLDLNSRPIITQDVTAPFGFRLWGHPVVLSSNIPTDQTNGSGSNQSYVLLTNPKYINVGDSDLQLAFSTDRYFDANQLAIRGVRRIDWAPGPASGVSILKGVNTQ